jgi:hypothetical protein
VEPEKSDIKTIFDIYRKMWLPKLLMRMTLEAVLLVLVS